MTTTEHTTLPRLLTPAELAAVVKAFREIRHWSQQQLADISGVQSRTIQRIEASEPSSLDSRRALASAFGFEDIDAFNKPYVIPTPEKMQADKERFDKENLTLKAVHVETGKQLIQLVDLSMASMFSEAVNLPEPAERLFAEISDFCREYADCKDLYSATDKLEVYAQLNGSVTSLMEQGFSIMAASREANFKAKESSSDFKYGILYVVIFPKGQEAENLAVPRAVTLG